MQTLAGEMGTMGESNVRRRTFSPASVAGLRVWLDASTLTASNGDPVALWPDLSGRGHHAVQSTTAARPSFIAGNINGLGALRSDGVDDFMSIADAGDLRFESITLMAVVRQRGGSSYQSWCQKRGGSVNFEILFEADVGRFAEFEGASVINSSFVPALNSVHVYELAGGSGGFSLLVDGVSVLTSYASIGSASCADPWLLFSFAGAEAALIDMGELVAVSGVASDSDRAALRSYLGAKWGVPV